MNDLSDINVFFIVALILAITFHEAAHGFAALAFGDPTAKQMHRVTLNPLRHIDLFGTILLPALLILSHAPALIGYAKPVPVNFSRLHPARLGTIAVAFAGPLMNLFLALLSAFALHLETWITPEEAPWLFEGLYNSIMINCLLAVFNMLPLLPLDGGRILQALLPQDLARSYARTERYGMLIILLLFMLPPLLEEAHLSSFSITTYLVYIPMDAMRDGILAIAGTSSS